MSYFSEYNSIIGILACITIFVCLYMILNIENGAGYRSNNMLITMYGSTQLENFSHIIPVHHLTSSPVSTTTPYTVSIGALQSHHITDIPKHTNSLGSFVCGRYMFTNACNLFFKSFN